MNRQIATKRLYSLGDYKNITFDDVITDVPTDLMFDQKLVGQIKFLQLVSVELAYRRYMDLASKVPYNMAPEEAIDILENMKHELITDIQKIVNGQLEA